jgi:hypothetical protein
MGIHQYSHWWHGEATDSIQNLAGTGHSWGRNLDQNWSRAIFRGVIFNQIVQEQFPGGVIFNQSAQGRLLWVQLAISSTLSHAQWDGDESCTYDKLDDTANTHPRMTTANATTIVGLWQRQTVLPLVQL